MTVAVTDAQFATAVVEQSRLRPVVVDFWATWCAPCRQLSPLLDRIGAEHTGLVDTLKMDVDANPQTSSMLSIRSIPTVVAFKDGRPVDAFLGAQPEQVVRDFYARLLPSEDDLLAEQASLLAPEDAEQKLRAILNRDPGHRGAILALAPIVDAEEALGLLARIPEDDDTRRIAAQIEIARGGAGAPEPVKQAIALAASDRYEQALEELLKLVRADHDRDAARQAMLDIFAVLGDDHSLVVRYRPELASALF